MRGFPFQRVRDIVGMTKGKKKEEGLDREKIEYWNGITLSLLDVFWRFMLARVNSSHAFFYTSVQTCKGK